MMRSILFFTVCIGSLMFTAAQQTAESSKEYLDAVAKAQEFADQGDFNRAEANYKKAAALNPQSVDASYNLGNLYYENTKKYNASNSYIKAVEAATTKKEKHRIFHNQGNLLLANKEYKKAVEAYKNALRNDPTDEETRYNLALAKREEDKQGGGGGGGDGDDDKDKKEDSESKDQENKEGDQNEKSDGKDEGKENKKDGGDKEDKGEGKDDDKGDPKDGENGDGKPKEQDQKTPQQRVEGKMTPQQIKQILEAMNNEEQKIRDKVNAKKVKGPAKRSEKDW